MAIAQHKGLQRCFHKKKEWGGHNKKGFIYLFCTMLLSMCVGAPVAHKGGGVRGVVMKESSPFSNSILNFRSDTSSPASSLMETAQSGAAQTGTAASYSGHVDSTEH